ncbi:MULTISPECIES: sulfite exporter TauE/SafE family protein [unclassified Streptomyces]|uniref:sulfite exporter TauE/SafE family protein n=1 Tax=unclassified Streptomyces TaxID=2593676 RepID=UPI0006F5ED02|nr:MULTISPECIES: sulfite exporter TauE/SafE family protein [unclassified Streptomyces]KQX49349.1 integral membrane family protein [Streptomyces sp. Root1304]KRA78967.1 integral membrane family protein [Streptomyces sp. Root66D1]
MVIALAAGAVVGLALGALGGGGSVLAVPVLIYLLGFTPPAAATASLLIVLATSATALYGHAKDGNVRWGTGALFAAAGIVPAALGGLLATRLPEALLTAGFAAVAGIAAVRMLRPASGAEGVRRPAPAVAGAGAGLGAVTGILGVGGGFLTVPALVQVVGLRMRTAVGTSLLVVAANALAALLARAGTADALDWAVIAPFAGAAILGAWDGRRLASKVSGDTLRRIFGAALLGVAGLMLLDAVVF